MNRKKNFWLWLLSFILLITSLANLIYMPYVMVTIVLSFGILAVSIVMLGRLVKKLSKRIVPFKLLLAVIACDFIYTLFMPYSFISTLIIFVGIGLGAILLIIGLILALFLVIGWLNIPVVYCIGGHWHD